MYKPPSANCSDQLGEEEEDERRHRDMGEMTDLHDHFALRNRTGGAGCGG